MNRSYSVSTFSAGGGGGSGGCEGGSGGAPPGSGGGASPADQPGLERRKKERRA